MSYKRNFETDSSFKTLKYWKVTKNVNIIYVAGRQVGAQAPPTFTFNGESIQDQFDEFLYISKHVCSTAPSKESNQISNQQLPPGKNFWN